MHYFIQHLNDLSGSPLVLRGRLDALPPGAPAILLTNQTEGFLSGWPGEVVRIPYVKHAGRIPRFLSLSLWYLRTMAWLLFRLRAGDQVTLSTLISSPLLSVILLRRDVRAEILVNEIFFRVPLWRTLGLRLARSPRVMKICLSRFVQTHWRFREPCRIIYPTLRPELIARAEARGEIAPKDRNRLTFFLVGSMIEAKGYRLFIEVARHYQALGAAHRFQLYLSGDPARFAAEYPAEQLPANLGIEFNNSDVGIFEEKDIFLGLTNTDLWLETFGQTFAEAMMMGNIVIVPDKGAQLEYVEDGVSGFMFREHSVAGVLAQIDRVLAHEDLNALAAQARRSICNFYGLD
jgi:glycosyltransferase involved in cell wall biosynthesis